MPRTTKTITFSLPPEMAERLDEVMQQQGRSRSEFLRDAVLRYIEECEWRQLLKGGDQRAWLTLSAQRTWPTMKRENRAEVSQCQYSKSCQI